MQVCSHLLELIKRDPALAIIVEIVATAHSAFSIALIYHQEVDAAWKPVCFSSDSVKSNCLSTARHSVFFFAQISSAALTAEGCAAQLSQ